MIQERLKEWLMHLAKNGGSDLYLTAGTPASAKFDGVLERIESDNLGTSDMEEIANSVMNDEQRNGFSIKPELNLAITIKDVGRFRINIFKQRNSFAMVIRNIVAQIPNLSELGLPDVLKKVIMEKRGLVLFVGATGSGKSTSLASLIDYRNSNSAGHIITIEDPIEFVHQHKRSIINQREVGVDTDTYEDALQNTLRQAPDVILIGEIRSQETMEHALAFAETGHLCLSTLHANNSNQALDRIINFFPEDRKNQLLQDLSLNLKGFISQRLVRTKDGKRAAAIEILLNSSIIAEKIQEGRVEAIKEIMEKSSDLGMQTFDMDLLRLYNAGKISYDEAIGNSDSPNNLKLKIKLNKGSGESEKIKKDVSSYNESKPAPVMDNAKPKPSKPSSLSLESPDNMKSLNDDPTNIW